MGLREELEVRLAALADRVDEPLGETPGVNPLVVVQETALELVAIVRMIADRVDAFEARGN
jgi:hypothetical protein